MGKEFDVPPKQIIFSEVSRRALLKGANVLADAVKITYGPSGRYVMIGNASGEVALSRDGATVAREIELPDPIENLGAQIVRQAASRTNELVGDGSTTATILAQAILREGLKCVAAGADPSALRRGIELGVEAVIVGLRKQSKRAASPEIRQAGTISANGDSSTGRLVAEALEKIGKDGFITLEESNTLESRLELVRGMQLERGYISHYFATNNEDMVVDIKNPYVLIFEKTISSAKSLLPILEQVAKSGRPLLVVGGNIEGEALSTLLLNNERGNLKVCAVKAPELGNYRLALLGDLAVMTGGRAITEGLGTELENAHIGDLGSAKRVLINKDKTRIIDGAGDIKLINSRVRSVRAELGRSVQGELREQLQRRLSKLSGWSGVIKVGALTETEFKEKKARIVSAIHAGRAAIEEGILPGGGIALLRCAGGLNALDVEGDVRIGVGIVRRICQEPLRHLIRSAGVEAGPVVDRILKRAKGARGFNAATGVVEDLVKSGIVDPTKVTRHALQSAASAAGDILNTDAVIVETRVGAHMALAAAARTGPPSDASRPYYESNLRVPTQPSAPVASGQKAIPPVEMTGGTEPPGDGGGKPPKPPEEPKPNGEEPAEIPELLVYPIVDPKPEHIVQDHTFLVEVSLQLKPPETDSTSGVVRVPPGDHTLWVHLLLGLNSSWDDLRWSSTRGTLKPAKFGVVAPSIESEGGKTPERQFATITVNFYLNGRWCGEALRNVEILLHKKVEPTEKIETAPKIKWRDVLSLDLHAEPPDLLVRIQYAVGDEYEWTMISPHLDLAPFKGKEGERKKLLGGPHRFVRTNFDNVSGETLDEKSEPVIRQRCREIYKSTSDSFKDAYWKIYDAEKAESGKEKIGLPVRLRSIQFISDEPFVPWELMLVRDEKRGRNVKEEILSIRHAVGRWVHDASSPLRQQIKVKDITVFASDYATVDGVEPKLPWAIEERDSLVNEYAALKGILKYEPVRQFFRDGASQAVHFACHGSMNSERPTESKLRLEDFENFVTAYLEEDEVREGEGKEHPLIFLNACQLAGAGPQLGLITGWPQTFLNSGASACVAPLWSVIDEKARDASAEFYELVFKQGKTLGEALQEVRRKWIEKKSLTYLSYVLYGDPMARVVWQRKR
jgi:chaperonin GroEL